MRLNKYTLMKSFFVIILMILLALMYQLILTSQDEQRYIKQILKNASKEEYAYLDLYTIYGNHMNVNGHLRSTRVTEDVTFLKSLDLVIKSKDEELKYPLNYDVKEDKIYFKLSENINQGVDLEKIPEGEYYVLIRAYGEEEETFKDYSIHNLSEYKDNEYYTLTKNDENRKVKLIFETLDFKKYYMNVFKITSNLTRLPQDVYDIVIDVGHGGRDPGAMSRGNEEADYTLQYSLLLKRELELAGFKVKLCREKDEYVPEYGEGGRAIIPYETKAKLCLSIHLNSSNYDDTEGGVEVYCPNHADLTFGKSIADNIVKFTNGFYSINSYARVMDGVYVRTYTEDEIEEAKEYAEELNYTFYETLTTDTPYLFMIREVGGIMTKAYIDGRNLTKKSNEYRNSNIAAESYLLELGFINSTKDIVRLTENKEAYVQAIVTSILNNYK